MEQAKLPGAKVMLLGASGAGKTESIKTLVAAGIETFVLFTEPGMEVLADTDPEKLHWHYIPPAAPDWADMIDSANKINTMSLKSLADMSDINKRKYGQFIELLSSLSNFRCDRTGKEYGAVDSWDASRAIVLDSMSGLSIMAMNLVTGSKPVKSMSDWGIAQDNLERLITKLCVDTQAFFVLIGHLEPEKDEVTGGIQLMASTLGKKLAPKLPRFFSDVVHVKRETTKFSWSTASYNVDSKARYLPIAEGLTPSFQPIVEKWRQLAGVTK